jgi:hypothetical protein
MAPTAKKTASTWPELLQGFHFVVFGAFCWRGKLGLFNRDRDTSGA